MSGSRLNDPVSRLARDYYHGLLTRESYRQQRTRLLDDLFSGDAAATNSATRPRPGGNERRAQPSPAGDPRNLGRRETDRRSPVVWIGAAAGVVAVLAIGWLLLSGGEPVGVAPVDTGALSAAADPARLGAFLTRRDWSEASVDDLRLRLAALPALDRRALERGPDFVRLVTEVRAQLSEQRALRELDGGGEGSEALAGLARELGLADALAVPANGPAVVARDEPPSVPAELTLSEPVSPVASDVGVPTPAGARPVDPAPAAARPSPKDAVPGAVVVNKPAPTVPTAAPVVAANPVSALTPAPTVTAPEPAPAPTKAQLAPTRPSAGSTPVAEVATAPPAAATVTAAMPVARAPAGPGGCTTQLLNSRRRYCNDTLPDGTDAPKMAVIAAGTYTMGSEWAVEEGPPRTVTIARPFAMSVYEVSQREFGRYCQATGRTCPQPAWNGDDYPMAGVSWEEATAYTAWLSEATGQTYRLPSEGEWEYAARAGVATRYPGGDELNSAAARFSADSPVPQSYRLVERNPFGLFHVIGNLREWVLDGWHDTHAGGPVDGSPRATGDNRRVVRGGSYADTPAALRLSSRLAVPMAGADRYTGFRVLRQL